MQRLRSRRLSALGAVAVLLGWSTLATAQSVDTEQVDHRGPAVSLALGSGYAADDGGGGIAAVGGIDIGWFFTERFLALVGASGVTRHGDEAAVNHTHTYFAAGYWLDSGCVGTQVVHLRLFGDIQESGGPYLPGVSLIASPASWIDCWVGWQYGSSADGLVAGVAGRL